MFCVLGGFHRGRGSEVAGVRTLFPRRLHCSLVGASRNMSRSELFSPVSPRLYLLSFFPVCRKELFKTVESPPGAEAGRGLDPLADDQPQPPAGVSGAAATGGAAAGGGAGLTGFIQSTLNQMFGGSGWTNPSPPPSHNHTSKLVLLLLSEPHQSWCVFADVSSSDSSSNAATSSQPQPQPPPRDSNGRVQTAELSLSPAPVKI